MLGSVAPVRPAPGLRGLHEPRWCVARTGQPWPYPKGTQGGGRGWCFTCPWAHGGAEGCRSRKEKDSIGKASTRCGRSSQHGSRGCHAEPRTGCASSAAVGPRHAVVAAPQVSGLGTAYGRRAALCPPPQRQYGQSPALSRKRSVLHRKFTPVKSGPCLLHMCVAQWQACNALTDGRPQRYGAPGDECPVRARDKNAGFFELSFAACAAHHAPAGGAWR